jgi:hypothetical protein
MTKVKTAMTDVDAALVNIPLVEAPPAPPVEVVQPAEPIGQRPQGDE